MNLDFIPIIKKQSKNEKALVVFSGGIDSTTALIWAYLNYNTVECISIDSHNLPNNTWQLDIRKKIIDYINDKNEIGISKGLKPFNYIKNIEVKMEWNNSHSETSYFGYSEADEGIPPQALLWASLISPFLKSDCDVIFGYIKNDEFWQYKHKILNIIYSFMCSKELKNTNIFFPFKNIEKKQIVQYLKDFNEDILKMCGYCEFPIVENNITVNCGMCHKCKQVKEQINDIELLTCTNISKNNIISPTSEEIKIVEDSNSISQQIATDEQKVKLEQIYKKVKELENYYNISNNVPFEYKQFRECLDKISSEKEQNKLTIEQWLEECDKLLYDFYLFEIKDKDKNQTTISSFTMKNPEDNSDGTKIASAIEVDDGYIINGVKHDSHQVSLSYDNMSGYSYITNKYFKVINKE